MKYLKGKNEPEWYDEEIGIDFVDEKVKAVGFDWLTDIQKAYYCLGRKLNLADFTPNGGKKWKNP